MMLRHRTHRQEQGYRVKHTSRLAHAPYWHRIRRYASAAFCIYLALLCVGVIEVVTQQQTADRYRLDDAGALIGSVSPALASKLSFDTQAQTYQFNQGYQPPVNAESVGGASYTASLPVDPREAGISLTDPVSKITLTLKPQFSSLPGKSQQGRLIYPLLGTNATMVYSPKSNGLKEDIIVPNYQGDELSFGYELDLPSGAEARMRPDGSIGIYTGDPALFGNVSTGSAKDQALLDKARQNSPKTNLAFVIPAPVVKETSGNSVARAHFTLTGTELTVHATNLTKASYPLSIDPSLALAGTSDWTGGNNEDDTIDYSVSGQISRTAMTGGSVGSWASNTNSMGSFQPTTIYNNYGYNIDVGRTDYEKLGSDGASFFTGASTNTSNGPTYLSTGGGNEIWTTVAYNGYMYSIGGVAQVATNPPCGGALQPSCTYTFQAVSNVQYAKINADGSLGAWTNTSSLAYQHQIGEAYAYNGYMYLINAYTSGYSYFGYTQYAKINADGSLGAWATSATFTPSDGVYASNVSTIYNGVVYEVGGQQGSPFNASAKVYYSRLSSSGFGAWQPTTSMNTPVQYTAAVAYGGYLYALGGCNQGGGAQCANNSNVINTVQMAPIYANGSLGPWQTINSMGGTNGRQQGTAFARNGYIYVAGGDYCTGTSGACTVNNVSTFTIYNNFQYAKINPAGEPGAFTTQTSFNTARFNYATAVYNGYLYVMGGDNNSGTFYQDVQYTQLTSTGSFTNPGCGTTWCTTTNMPNKRNFIHAIPYNGYMYLSGGNSTLGNQQEMYYAPINSNGTLGSWTSTNSYSGSRVNYGMVQTNGYLYVLGGWNGSGNNSDCQFAKITGPALGTWSSCANLLAGNSNMGATSSGGYIYYMGGSQAGTASAKVYYAKPNPTTGALTSWSTLPDLPQVTNYPRAAVSNGTLYVLGGMDASGNWYTTVQYASLRADGSLTGWTTAAQPLTIPRASGGAEVYQGYLYGIGANANATSESAPLNNGGPGTTGTWTTATNSVSINRSRSRSVVVNGYLYAISGCSSWFNNACNGLTSTVEYSQLDPVTGQPGGWSTTSANITPREFFSAFTYNGYLYILGGCTAVGCGSTTRTIQYAQPGSDGNVTAWATNPTNLPTVSDLTAERATVTNGYVYDVTSSGTFYAAIDPTAHTIGSWTTTTNPLTMTDGYFEVATNGAYLYRVSGIISGTTTNEVEYAPINSDHTLGAWNYTSPMLLGRDDGFCVGIYDGYIYAASGFNTGASPDATTEYAPINANGSLGAWQMSTTLNLGRQASSGAIYNGFLYTVGGKNAGNAVKSLEFAPLQSIPRVAHYSKLFTTDKNTMPVNYFVTNVPQTGSTVTVGYETATTASPTFTALSAITNPSSGTKYPVSISGDGVNYYWVTITIDDSQSASFGSETPSYISYFQLNYHPNPSMRLRGGKTFNQNKLQGLDAP